MNPPDTTTPAPRRNVLPLPDLIRLTDWARANPVLCADTSNTKLAIIAGASLTLNVTAANVASVLEACGIEKTKRLPSPTIEERVGLLEEKLALLTGMIQGFREDLDLLRQPSARLYPTPQIPTSSRMRDDLDAMIQSSIEPDQEALHHHLTGGDRPTAGFAEDAPWTDPTQKTANQEP